MAIASLAACSASAPASDPVVPAVDIESDGPLAPSLIELDEPEPKLADEACEERFTTAKALTESSVGADRDLFVAVLEARRTGDLQRARRQLLELVQTHATSPFVPYALLQFGEIFALEAEREPAKRGIALAAYRQAREYPYPAYPTFFLCSLRLADLQRAEGEHSDALAGYRDVMAATRSHPEAPCMAALGAQARRGLVLSYAHVGRPARALAFFSVSGPSHTDARMMAVELVAAYAELAKMAEAEQVARDIVSSASDVGVCRALREQVVRHRLKVAMSTACD